MQKQDVKSKIKVVFDAKARPKIKYKVVFDATGTEEDIKSKIKLQI